MQPTRLILVRHGETLINKLGILQGQKYQGRLSQLGLRQAVAAGNYLKNQLIHAIYSSDLGRAWKTAEKIAIHHPHLAILTAPALRERSYGVFDGKHPDLREKAMQASGLPFHEFKPEKGESLREVKNRIGIFMDEVVRRHPGKNVVLVSHAATIGAACLHLLRQNFIEYASYRPANASVTVITIGKNKKATLEISNSIEHLREI